MTHATLLKQLMPASLDIAGRVLAAQLQAEGAALDSAAAHADLILSETDPRTTFAQLLEWERVFGRSAAADTVSRRQFLIGKCNELGGQSAAYFTSIAASLGFAISITEYQPSSVMTDMLAMLMTPEWRLVWQINVAAGWNYAYALADINSSVSEPLARWNQNADFEAALREDAPAHTQLLFKYN